MKGQGFACEAVEESEILDSECRNDEVKRYVDVGFCRGRKKIMYKQIEEGLPTCLLTLNTCLLMPDILQLHRQALRQMSKTAINF